MHSLKETWPIWPTILLVIITALVFSSLFANSFTTWDDSSTLWRNPSFNPPALAGIAQYWTRPHMDLYVPVTYTLWGVLAFLCYSPEPDAQGAMLSTVPFHLANLALHIGSTLLVYRLIRKILSPAAIDTRIIGPALLGALVFALHPLQVETVAWLSGTKDLLFAFLTLLALSIYLSRGDRPAKAYLLATLALIAALLSKPTAIVVPPMALLLDIAILKTPWRRSVLLVAPWFLLAVATAVVTKLV